MTTDAKGTVMRKLILAAVATSVLALAAGPVLADGIVGGSAGHRFHRETLDRRDAHRSRDVRGQQPSRPSQYWPLLGERPVAHGPRFHSRHHRFAPPRFHRPPPFQARHPYAHRFAPQWWYWKRW